MKEGLLLVFAAILVLLLAALVYVVIVLISRLRTGQTLCAVVDGDDPDT